MKQYRVAYDGLCLGGRSIVIAHTEQEASDLVRDDYRTTNFTNVVVEDCGQLKIGSVMWNWNGDPKWLEDSDPPEYRTPHVDEEADTSLRPPRRKFRT